MTLDTAFMGTTSFHEDSTISICSHPIDPLPQFGMKPIYRDPVGEPG
jgi:hypothetical protein